MNKTNYIRQFNASTIVLLLLAFSLVRQAHAQDSTKSIQDLSMNDEFSIEDLMNVKLTVASQSELTQWQTPSCVSVFTREDLDKTGARDLTDLIRLIPGFEFGADVSGAVGIGVRGNWGTEGKVLVLLDGMQMNENMYGGSQWIGRYDINQIDRIEVVRGPGYAYYNGFASLGVINIISKKGKDLNGMQLSANYGQLQNTMGRATASVSGGFQHKDLDFSVHAYGGQLYRFSGNYSDNYGSTMQLNDGSNNLATPLQIKANLEYKGIVVKYLHEDFNYKSRIAFGANLMAPSNVDFSTRQFDLSYKWVINDKVTIKPQINFNYNRPWTSNQVKDTLDPGYFFYDKSVTRYAQMINANIKLKSFLKLNVGVGHFQDRDYSVNSNVPAYNITDKHVYDTWYDYAELLLEKNKTVASLGFRNEIHNVFGSVFLPRLALTQNLGRFNLKCSYSHAFRAPLVENIATNPLIRPEKTIVSEIELAYKINDHWLMSANIFDITIADPIVYGTDGTTESYHNYSALGTRGAEAELNYRSKKLMLTATYSYYINTKNDVQTFDTPNKEMLMGFANYKVTANAAYDLSNNISLTANIVCLSNKYAYTGVDGDGNRTLSLLAPSYTLNTKITFANFEQLKGLSFGIGCYNALDNKYLFAQAYQGDLNPISSLGREWVLHVKYLISKTK